MDSSPGHEYRLNALSLYDSNNADVMMIAYDVPGEDRPCRKLYQLRPDTSNPPEKTVVMDLSAFQENAQITLRNGHGDVTLLVDDQELKDMMGDVLRKSFPAMTSVRLLELS